MATNTTLADLIGSASTAKIESDITVGDVQESSPPGVSATFSTSLGEKGRFITLVGLLRFQDAVLATAVTAINAKRLALIQLREAGTLLNVFTGSTGFEVLHGQITDCTVRALRLGERTKSLSGATYTVNQNYQLVLKKQR